MTPAELKVWRKAQGLSQERLAALLGVDEMTISRWERGKPAIPPYLHLALKGIAYDYLERVRAELNLPADRR